MKKAIKVIVVVGLCLLIAGGAVFAIGMSKIGWDFKKLSNVDVTTESMVIADDFNSINVNASVTDISILQSEDNKVTVDYCIVKNKNGEVIRQIIPAVQDGVLVCKEEQIKEERFGFGYADESLVIKMPADKIVELNVVANTGNIKIGSENTERTFSSINIEASTGNLKFEGKTISQNNLNVKMATGNVKFNADVVAKAISINASTGNIKGDAKIDFDSLVIETSTGSVKINTALSKDNYSFLYSTSTGDCNIDPFIGGAKQISIKTSTGDIDIYFAE